MKKDADLIRDLGNDVEVAALVTSILKRRPKFSPETIRKWREHGIPWKYRPMMYRLLQRERLSPPDDFIEVRRAA